MALLTQYVSFYVSPFGEKSVTDELNAFLRSHRIVNVEKKMIDGERGTGWVFLIEYGTSSESKNSPGASPQRTDYREVLNPVQGEPLFPESWIYASISIRWITVF